MKNKVLWSLLVTGLAVFSAHAKEKMPDRDKCDNTNLLQGQTSPSFLETSFSLDYLLMRAINSDLAFARDMILEETPGAYDNIISQAFILRPKRTWRPGFRFEMGFQSDRMDDWQTATSWTYYYNKSVINNPATDHKVLTFLNGEGYFAYFTPPILSFNGVGTGTFFENMQGIWQLNYNMIDWMFKRDYRLSKSFVLKPQVGLGNGWIYQQIKSFFLRGLGGSAKDLLTTMHNNFWGIGFKGGVGFDWKLGMGFNIQSNMIATFLSGRTKMRRVLDINPIQALRGDLGSELLRMENGTFRVHHIAPGFQFDLGLGWETVFSNREKKIALFAGWESMYWWGQFSLSQWANFTASGAEFNRHTEGDYPYANRGLQIEGIKIRGTFDF